MVKDVLEIIFVGKLDQGAVLARTAGHIQIRGHQFVDYLISLCHEDGTGVLISNMDNTLG